MIDPLKKIQEYFTVGVNLTVTMAFRQVLLTRLSDELVRVAREIV